MDAIKINGIDAHTHRVRLHSMIGSHEDLQIFLFSLIQSKFKEKYGKLSF